MFKPKVSSLHSHDMITNLKNNSHFHTHRMIHIRFISIKKRGDLKQNKAERDKRVGGGGGGGGGGGRTTKTKRKTILIQQNQLLWKFLLTKFCASVYILI